MDKKLLNISIAADAKERNLPFLLDEETILQLIKRVAGEKYADHFIIRKIEANTTGMDRYRLSNLNGKALIEATSGVAAAVAFRYYLEHCCHSYVGPLTRRLDLPSDPCPVSDYADESVCLYRYFLNYCTFGYTLVFWKWEQWQNLLDWMMMAGYNLVLNPLGNETVWKLVLDEFGYTAEEINNYLSGPAFFPWQCMMNLTTWGDAAPESFYMERIELSKKINDYLHSFGAAPMLPGFSGMVPSDFKEHFPDSQPFDQGLWCSMPRPAILLPSDDGYFDRVAECFYRKQKDLFGSDFKYFSTDPFHEGGNSEGVNLKNYAKKCLDHMRSFCDEPIWFLQGWQNNPIRDMICALNPGNVLIGNLRSTDLCDGGDDFADYPWLYCCVNNFGGQRVMRGNMNKMLNEAFSVITDDNYTAVGLGIIPEGIECDEILFDIFADLSIRSTPLDSDKWLNEHLEIRYGRCPSNTFEAWKILRDKVFVGDTELIPMESALLTRPSLTVKMVSSYSTDCFSYDIDDLKKALCLLAKDIASVPESESYRLDLLDIARQVVANNAWQYLKGIQKSFTEGKYAVFEENVSAFMHHYDLQSNLLSCDHHMLLGNWLKNAEQYAETPSEKAYFEYLARTLITLWGNREGASELHDYAAREYSGLLEDFYRPRWESFINILRRSIVTGKTPRDFERYDAEYFFTTLSKKYPTEESGNWVMAISAVVNELCSGI